MRKLLPAIVIALAAGSALAATPQDFLNTYSAEAKKANPAFAGFSAERGKALYNSKPKELACVSCHTENPAGPGKHASTGREIKPMAPSANPERFTDAEKVERFYKRQCDAVFGRECTAQEKGDFLTYLLSAR